jgi:RNA polymerase sigma-70 factor (ECF subfamily)
MERAEFERLALDQLEPVYRMALQLTRNPEQAQDLVQEVYARALERGVSDRFEERGRGADGVRAWLFTIAHHTFYSNLRRGRHAPTAMAEFFDQESSETPPDEPPPAWDLASLDWEQVDDRLKAAIDRLRPEYREVLLLWGVEGLKYREIAEIVGVPIGTVMSRLHRARKLVADEISGPDGFVSENRLTPTPYPPSARSSRVDTRPRPRRPSTR